MEAAERLAAERDDAEDALKRALDDAGASPMRALHDGLDRIAELHDDVRIEGTLVVAGSTSGAVASFTRGDVVLGAGSCGLRVDLADWGVPARLPSHVAWNDESDVLTINAMPIELPLGTLVIAAIDALAASDGLRDGSAWVASRGGCAALASWVASEPVIASACGASCVTSVCEDVAGQALEWLRAAAAPIDAVRSGIALTGLVRGEDENGDLAVDALASEGLAGVWTDEDGTPAIDAVSASFGGERVAPLR